MQIPTTNFYGLKLSTIEKDKLFETVYNTITNKEKIVIYGYSLGSVRLMRKLPIMYHFGKDKAEIMLVDGRGLYLLGKLLGFQFKDDISIPEFSMQLLNFADINKYSVMMFGASKKSNLNATTNVRNKYPNTIVYDGINGYFNINQELEIVKRINEAKPDILFVGISTPLKEEFITRWKEQLEVKIILLCGGVIDIIAGNKQQTPKVLKKMGLASIFRFIQEPKRLSPYFFPFLVFLFFNFLPVLLVKVLIFKNKNFSIPKYYKLL